MWPRSSTRLERRPHGPRLPVLGEDVLVSGAGPIGLMATAVVRHAGARFVVVSEPNPLRRELAARMGATVVVDPRERDLHDVQHELGMVEDSTSRSKCPAARLPSGPRSPTWPTAARSPFLGIPTEEVTPRPQRDHLQDADHARDLRPGDVRDLVQDDGDAPIWPRHHARDHPPLRSVSTRPRSRPPGREGRQGHPRLDDVTGPAT